MATKKDFRKAIEKVKARYQWEKERGISAKDASFAQAKALDWEDAYASLFLGEKDFDEHWFRKECAK